MGVCVCVCCARAYLCVCVYIYPLILYCISCFIRTLTLFQSLYMFVFSLSFIVSLVHLSVSLMFPFFLPSHFFPPSFYPNRHCDGGSHSHPDISPSHCPSIGHAHNHTVSSPRAHDAVSKPCASGREGGSARRRSRRRRKAGPDEAGAVGAHAAGGAELPVSLP